MVKSLEIVKDKLYLIERYPLKMKVEISETEIAIDKEQLEKIEKDLEVLEILKKYLYIVENQIPRTDDYFEILETDLDEMQDDENCDDFHRVKQWLESNKVGENQ